MFQFQKTFRDLIYVTRILQGRIAENTLYGSTPIKLPTPRFVVFYNGTTNRPDLETLKLSSLYEKAQEHPDLELLVTVYNINYGKNRDIMECCRILRDYAGFDYVEQTKSTDINQCFSDHQVFNCSTLFFDTVHGGDKSMNRNVEFTKLMRMARDHMEDNGFSPTSVSSYMRTWRSVYNFGLSKGITKYSAELAEQYMLEKYHVSIGETQLDGEPLTPYMQQKVRALKALTDFKLHGFVTKTKPGMEIEWPAEYEGICKKYLAERKSYGLADQTLRKLEIDLFRFASFLHSRGTAPEQIGATDLYDYFKTLAHLAKASLVTIRSNLRGILKYFCQQGVTPKDLSEFVPRIHYYAKAKIDKVWSDNEIEKMLNSIDRANPMGKRDYAIMAIAANLGLRTGDIIALSIDSFDWVHGCITLTQQKTGEPLTLPISEQIGKAVIDYWMNGRPKTNARELFVEHVLPYQKLKQGILYHIFNKYYESSGITTPDTRQRGLHSLRHSLASRLLEKDTPVNVISNILGHVDSNSAKSYIQIDIEKLRQCSLEVPDYES